MGLKLVKTNMFKIKIETSNKPLKKKSKKNTPVIIDGVFLKKDSRVNICVECGKISCYKHNHQHICTSAGNWYNIKKKYKYKVLGNYRLKLYIKKCKI